MYCAECGKPLNIINWMNRINMMICLNAKCARYRQPVHIGDGQQEPRTIQPANENIVHIMKQIRK